MTRDTTTGRRLVGLFLLGLLLFNYPFISMFNRPVLALGIPAFYFYLFTAWTLIILLALIISRVTPDIQFPDQHR